jgi:hypothetical protein
VIGQWPASQLQLSQPLTALTNRRLWPAAPVDQRVLYRTLGLPTLGSPLRDFFYPFDSLRWAALMILLCEPTHKLSTTSLS